MSSKNNLVLYEIYPRSFQDSNGDGYGDLQGIISRLDYLKDLGINAIWITPFFPSPMKDVGYDVKDYCDVAEEFGSLQDFAQLIKEAHDRDIKVVIDLVINHTSEEHPWFIESRSSLDNPKRDWYIWKDAVDGHEPNNWMSVFEPVPWTWDEKTKQYYFHSFLSSQPDLNWANPDVMEAIQDVIKFWIGQGVDGFRLDSANSLWKDQRFLDEPDDPNYVAGKVAPYYKKLHLYMRDQETAFDIIDELGKFIDANGGGFMITESYVNKSGIDAIHIYKKYYERVESRNVIPFNFELLRIPWTASSFREFITEYLQSLQTDELPTFVFGNHDRSRLATKFSPIQARLAAVLLLTLPGMPVIYYGEELGMEDVSIPEDRLRDTKAFTSPGFGRDPERTPMQWDTSENAGFTTGIPWLPLEDTWKERNVAVQAADPDSMLNLYKKLLHMKQHNPVFRDGVYATIDVHNEEVYAYSRTIEDESYLVLLNFSDTEQLCDLPSDNFSLVLSTYKKRADVDDSFILQPQEACILKWRGFNRR